MLRFPPPSRGSYSPYVPGESSPNFTGKPVTRMLQNTKLCKVDIDAATAVDFKILIDKLFEYL
jgi:hypothetical protein